MTERFDVREGGDLVEQGGEGGVVGDVCESGDLVDEVGSAHVEIRRDGYEPGRVEPGAEHVDRWPGQLGGELCDEALGCLVGEQHVPVTVEHHPRVRVVGVEQLGQRRHDRCQVGVVETGFVILRGVTSCDQHDVAFAQGDIEVVRDREDQFRAGARSAGLDEAEMPW